MAPKVDPSPAKPNPPSVPVAVKVPVQLHAFVLNEATCNAGPSCIAPIVRPDYRALRPGESLKHDILPHIDLQGCENSKVHPRIKNLAPPPAKLGREGIYLHWTLPPLFRTGTARTRVAGESDELKEREAPDRWVLVRRISIPPPAPAPSSPAPKEPPPFTHVTDMFMIESNRIRRIQDKDLDGLDVEIEAAPFVDRGVASEKQGDYYIGKKFKLSEWHEEEDSSQSKQSPVHLHPFTLLGASNPFFADCQAHNSNVFSVHDDLSYPVWDPTSKKYSPETKKATVASVSYLLMGYYNIQAVDPFYSVKAPNANSFKKFRMELPNDQSELLGKASPNHLTLVCHGELKNVLWNETAAPSKTIANEAANSFRTGRLLSVGEELTDAVSAWFANVPNPKLQKLANAFKDLQLLAHNPDDHDEVMLQTTQQLNTAFEPADGGQTWRLIRKPDAGDKAGSGFVPLQPDELQTLRALDATQRLRDSCVRQMSFLRHLFYCEWWKSRAATPDEEGIRKSALAAAADLLRSLELYRVDASGSGPLADLAKIICFMSPAKNGHYESVPNARFYSWKDPAISLIGLRSDWLFDPSQMIPVQLLYSDSVAFKPTQTPSGPTIRDNAPKLPAWFQSIFVQFCNEWFPSTGVFAQQDFNNQVKDSTQGFYPLFVEWEVQYFHIPWDNWVLRELPNGLVKYELDLKKFLDAKKDLPKWSRGLAGRTPIVPEPAKTIKEQINTVVRRSKLQDAPNILSNDDKEALTEQLSGWNTFLLSGTLAGISDHLLTLVHGTHLIPDPNAISTVSSQNDPFVGVPARLHLSDRRTMGVTPYGQVPIDGLSGHFEESSSTLFRPVTHGQVRFTKFNIVDKFGQVIRTIDDSGRSNNEPRDKLIPRVSSAMECQIDRSNQAPLTPEAEAIGHSEFFQLSPRINQKSRLNAHFLVPEDGSKGWRAAQERENPVWAWLMVNFKDNSIQIYRGNGIFYGELLIGVGNDRDWIGPPSGTDDRVTISNDHPSEIERLMIKLRGDRSYRESVWNMLIDANEHIHHAPNSYGDLLPALLGRPMALVHTGFSLELAHEPMKDQSLGPKSNTADTSVKELKDYEFKIKIGHKHSLHDGFVALIPQVQDTGTPAPNDAVLFDYGKMYTYFGHGESVADGDKPSLPGPLFVPQELCGLNPYFIDPGKYTATAQSIAAFQQDHYKMLRVFTAIIDPFHATHVFSGMLPMQKLQIPSWILEQTLEKMSIIFRAGPFLIPGDIPSEAAVDAARLKTADKNPNVTRAHIKIPVDSPSAGDWLWFQSVRDDNGKLTHRGFNTKPMDRSFHLPHGPSTAAEGFLCIKGPPHGASRFKEQSTTTSSGSGKSAPVTMDSVLSNAVTNALATKKTP